MFRLKKFITLLLLIFSAILLFSCSTTRKAKKKCRECPEFSFVKPVPASTPILHDEI